MADEDIVARMERMLAEKEQESVVKKVAKNGGGLVAGGYVGTLAAPVVVGAVSAILAPFTGGLSLAAGALVGGAVIAGSAVMGHKMAKDID
jgi:hypothetical protein